MRASVIVDSAGYISLEGRLESLGLKAMLRSGPKLPGRSQIQRHDR